MRTRRKDIPGRYPVEDFAELAPDSDRLVKDKSRKSASSDCCLRDQMIKLSQVL